MRSVSDAALQKFEKIMINLRNCCTRLLSKVSENAYGSVLFPHLSKNVKKVYTKLIQQGFSLHFIADCFSVSIVCIRGSIDVPTIEERHYWFNGLYSSLLILLVELTSHNLSVLLNHAEWCCVVFVMVFCKLQKIFEVASFHDEFFKSHLTNGAIYNIKGEIDGISYNFSQKNSFLCQKCLPIIYMLCLEPL